MTRATKFTFPMFYSDYFPPSTCRSYSTYSRQYIHSTKIIFGCQSAILFKCFSNMGVQNISKITCSVQEVKWCRRLEAQLGTAHQYEGRSKHMNYPKKIKRTPICSETMTANFHFSVADSNWTNIFQMTRDETKSSQSWKKNNIKYQTNVKTQERGKLQWLKINKIRADKRTRICRCFRCFFVKML